MKKRLPYCISFALVFLTEILIGAYIKDDFIRPYVGDMLVTVLLCCLGRIFFPERFPWLPVTVFLFAGFVECFQLIDIPALDGTLFGIILGSTFDPKDLLCYGIGCTVFFLLDRQRRSSV